MCWFITICSGEEMEGVVYSHHLVVVCFVILVVFCNPEVFKGVVYAISCFFSFPMFLSCFFRRFE